MDQCDDECLHNWRAVGNELNSHNLGTMGTDIGVVTRFIVNARKTCDLTNFSIFEADAGASCSVDIGCVHDGDLVVSFDSTTYQGEGNLTLCRFISGILSFLDTEDRQIIVCGWHLVVKFGCERA
jgi:hypothetical protein